jgi:acyl-CoA thioester hydrolase
MKCHFKSPAKYKDQIIIFTKIKFVSYVTIKFEYNVINKANEKVIATGTTVHAWTNKRIEPINIKKAAPEVYNKIQMLVVPPSI